MSLVDADGGAEVGDGCSHPLLEAKTPRELALLVKHYRLLQARQEAGFVSPWVFWITVGRAVRDAVEWIEAGKLQRSRSVSKYVDIGGEEYFDVIVM